MVQRHRCLNQCLEKLLFRIYRCPPDVLQHLMCVVKLTAIEQLNPVMVCRRIHPSILLQHYTKVYRNFGNQRVIRPSFLVMIAK